MNSRIVFLTVLEARKSKIKSLESWVSAEELLKTIEYLLKNLLKKQTGVFSLCSHMAEGGSEVFNTCFMRALIPFMRTVLL